MTTISAGGLLTKSPSEALMYIADWDQYALTQGASLADAGSFRVSPSGLSVGSAELMAGNRTVEFLVSGGVRGKRYRIWHRVTTTQNPARTFEQSFYVLVQ